MKNSKSQLVLGESIYLSGPELFGMKFVVKAQADDEYIMSPFTEKQTFEFPKSNVVIGKTAFINQKKVSTGDKIQVSTKEGKKMDMYVSYILDKDSIVLSIKNKPSLSSLKWIIKMMDYFIS